MQADPNDLITVSDLQQWSSSSDPSATDLLQEIVTACSYEIFRYLNRPQILSQSYADRYDGDGGTVLPLWMWPVLSITSVQVGSVVIPQSPDYIQAGWMADDYSVSLIGYEFRRGRLNVAVTYTAGYAAVPPDLQQACKILCDLRLKERAWNGKRAQDMAGQSSTFDNAALPPQVAALLGNYKLRI